MDVKVTLDLEKLKERLCQDCRAVLDLYLKELAVEALQKETTGEGEK